uniref:Uncharacterized protein n=1 Tax=Coprothermobacter proteolyticus (strain ATCC 35245 / DSM 5265 / OCM 4 / BT) TaxID=309798 RepID=B5Y6P7_COPPD
MKYCEEVERSDSEEVCKFIGGCGTVPGADASRAS